MLTFSANWRKKFGYEPIANEISGRIPLSENIHPEDMPAFKTIMKETAAGKPYSEAEFRIKDSKGRYRWWRAPVTCSIGVAVFPHGALQGYQRMSCEPSISQRLRECRETDIVGISSGDIKANKNTHWLESESFPNQCVFFISYNLMKWLLQMNQP